MSQEPFKFESDDALISALMDGELSSAEISRALAAVDEEARVRDNWLAYHRVGEVLREHTSVEMSRGDLAFAARLRQRLEREDHLNVAHALPSVPVSPERPLASEQAAANDAVWRWRSLAGVGALAVAAWLAWQFSGTDSAITLALKEQSASAPTVVAVNQPAGVMLRDPRLDQLIAAHQQQGGASPLLMPAGFLRNATYDRR